MYTSLKNFGIFILLISAISCSSSEDGTPPGERVPDEPLEFAGEWEAQEAIFDIAFDDEIETVDFIGEGGAIDLSIQENGRFSIDFIFGTNSETITGQMNIWDNNLLSIVFDYSPDEISYFEIQQADGALQIDGGPLEYDFEGDGSAEPALVSFVFAPK